MGLPIFMWAGTATGWLITVTAAVRVRADCLVMDNWLVRHVIPWERSTGLFVEEGVGMFARLDDGTVVKSLAYASSLSDAMQGYDHMRETLERIRADCQQARTGPGRRQPGTAMPADAEHAMAAGVRSADLLRSVRVDRLCCPRGLTVLAS